MPRLSIFKSVVARLVACLVLGGVVLSIGLWVLEVQRSQATLRMDLARRTTQTARNLQTTLRWLGATQSRKQVEQIVTAFTVDPSFRAARVTEPGQPAIQAGDWPPGAAALPAAVLREQSIVRASEVDLRRLTLVRAPFNMDGRLVTLEFLIDGPAAWAQMRDDMALALEVQWLLLAVMTLVGLFLLRRWFIGPLSEAAHLASTGAGATPFYRLAREHSGEFARLGEAIGGMLTRLECTGQRLRQREQAFEDLYQFAPAAMVNLEADGKIVEANRRAAELLGVPEEKRLIDQNILEFVRSEDRAMLRQTIDRLDVENTPRCELRLQSGGGGGGKDTLTPALSRGEREQSGGGARTIDALVECTGVRDEDGKLLRVRLSMLDVSLSKQLQRQLADKSRLLNLVIDHMSDAILLVDHQGKIAAHNQQLAALLHLRPDQIGGAAYDPAHFWDELGVIDHELFVSRLRQIDADRHRPAQERFEARAGTFLFQGIPVSDGTAQVIGRLWVVQEITLQEQGRKLVQQQQHQLQALRRLGQSLSDVGGVDDLLERAGQYLYDVLGVEAVGLAIRRDREGSRSEQVVNRGTGGYLLAPNQALVRAVEAQLMPQTLASHDLIFWPDLPVTLPWAKAFTQAGLTCVAASPLRGSADAQGIVWVGRRGGERLERHHLYLIEAMAPVIAARIEFAQLRDRMHDLEMTDPVTDLPNHQQFQKTALRLQNRPGQPWAALHVNLDRFRELNQELDHPGADQLLRTVAAGLQGALRRSCYVARLEGPTFGILAPGTGGPAALALAERLRAVVAAQTVALPDGSQWPLTVSIGLACGPEDGPQSAAVLALAASRAEMAKRAGRNRVVGAGLPADRQVG